MRKAGLIVGGSNGMFPASEKAAVLHQVRHPRYETRSAEQKASKLTSASKGRVCEGRLFSVLKSFLERSGLSGKTSLICAASADMLTFWGSAFHIVRLSRMAESVDGISSRVSFADYIGVTLDRIN